MTVINTLKTSKIVFVSCILTSGFWFLGQFVNVYHFAVVGVFFEIIWLPMIALLFILPIFSFIYWIKEKFSTKSLYLYSFIIALTTLLYMILMN